MKVSEVHSIESFFGKLCKSPHFFRLFCSSREPLEEEEVIDVGH